LYLCVIQIKRIGATEHGNANAQAAALGIHFLYNAVLTLESAVKHNNLVLDVEHNLLARSFTAASNLAHQVTHVTGGHGEGFFAASASEADNTIYGLNLVPGIIIKGAIRAAESKVKINITGVQLALLYILLTIANLLNLLCGNEGFTLVKSGHLFIFHEKTLEIFYSAALFVGKNMKSIPLILGIRGNASA
jgi:hypothetical protein